jgi:hypothetical protein
MQDEARTLLRRRASSESAGALVSALNVVANFAGFIGYRARLGEAPQRAGAVMRMGQYNQYAKAGCKSAVDSAKPKIRITAGCSPPAGLRRLARQICNKPGATPPDAAPTPEMFAP